jgi:hypothetical protein
MNKAPKPRRCKVCENVFIPKQFMQVGCSIECAIKYSKILKENKVKAEWRIEKKALTEKLKTLSQYEAEAKKSFQKWVRLRDKDQPCISCGNTKPTDWCGSHYFSAGMYSGLMFDPRNCHGACNTYCNKYLSGNLIEYRKGLVNRYGLEYVEKLESEADQKRNHKYAKHELIAKKLQYDLLIKEMK